jgi:hypothetical protein
MLLGNISSIGSHLNLVPTLPLLIRAGPLVSWLGYTTMYLSNFYSLCLLSREVLFY